MAYSNPLRGIEGVTLNEIREIAEDLKKGDYQAIQDGALREWLSTNFKDNTDLTSYSWVTSVLAVFASKGYVVRKKNDSDKPQA